MRRPASPTVPSAGSHGPGAVGRWQLLRGGIALAVFHAVCLLALIILGPVLLWRLVFDRRYRTGLAARTGRVPPTTGTRPVVWVHGVSVGEIKAAGTLIAEIERCHPDLEIVVSATTPTGFDLARRLHAERRVVHFPIDFGRFPGRALDRIRPCCVLLVELEIWPNFLQAAARRAIPVGVINGRISESSFRGYRLVRPLLPQFGWIERFCVQNGTYRDRLLALGIPATRIAVTGNMKYDSVLLQRIPEDSGSLRDWLAADDRQVLVCGSTHGREEEWLVEIWLRLVRSMGRSLRLVLVPRHPERVPPLLEQLAELGVGSACWSARQDLSRPLAAEDVVIVDTIGHLERFYGACDVAFVGGSLVPRGGQNMLEPAAMGRAVVFGPHTANFRKDVEQLLEARAAIQVDSVAALEKALFELLMVDAARADLGSRAVELIRRNQGATERTRQILEPILTGSGVAERPVPSR